MEHGMDLSEKSTLPLNYGSCSDPTAYQAPTQADVSKESDDLEAQYVTAH